MIVGCGGPARGSAVDETPSLPSPCPNFKINLPLYSQEIMHLCETRRIWCIMTRFVCYIISTPGIIPPELSCTFNWKSASNLLMKSGPC